MHSTALLCLVSPETNKTLVESVKLEKTFDFEIGLVGLIGLIGLSVIF